MEGKELSSARKKFDDPNVIDRVQQLLLQRILECADKPDDKKAIMPIAYDLSQFSDVGILVIGPSKGGKSTLLSAITKKDVPSSAGWQPHTSGLGHYKVSPNSKVVFWDTKGIEKWSRSDIEGFVEKLIKDIKPQERPACCIFVARTVGNNMQMDLMEYLLTGISRRLSMPLFFVVSDVYAANFPDDIYALRNGAGTNEKGYIKMLSDVTNSIPELHASISAVADPPWSAGKDIWQCHKFGERTYSFEINSKDKIVGGVKYKASGVAELMSCIIENMDPSHIASVMVSLSCYNRSWWDMFTLKMTHMSVEVLRAFLPVETAKNVSNEMLGNAAAEAYERLRKGVKRDWKSYVDSINDIIYNQRPKED